MSEPIHLNARYADPLAGARAAAEDGTPIIGVTSNTVPWEPLLAAGLFPVLLHPSTAAMSAGHSYADRLMEAVFEERIRAIFDMVAANDGVRLRSVVIPRTSEQEHKLFLYLRELARLEPTVARPEAYLYNLLHTRSPESERYGLASTHALLQHAEKIGSKRITAESLHLAVESGNRCRKALRELHRLRLSSENPVSGTDALQWMGASYFTEREEYARQLNEVLQAQRGRLPRRGKRILIKGAPLSYLELHQAIEQHDATVVAEDDWWGSRAAMPDIATEGDAIEAIFSSYYLHAQSPRVFPPAAADEWFLSVAEDVDAVVFYLPGEDDVYGWDYPRWRDVLNDRGMPHLLVRDDARKGMSAGWHEAFEAFLSSR